MKILIGHAHLHGVPETSVPWLFDRHTSGGHVLTFEFEAARRLDEEWYWPMLLGLDHLSALTSARVRLYVQNADGSLVRREMTVWIDFYATEDPSVAAVEQLPAFHEITDGPGGMLRSRLGEERLRIPAWWTDLFRSELRVLRSVYSRQLAELDQTRVSLHKLCNALALQ